MSTLHVTGNVIDAGRVRVDTDARTVRVDGRLTKQLTKREFAVLCVLARQPDACVSRERLVRQVWRPAHVTRASLRTVDSVVCLVRAKLRDASVDGARLIENVWACGYRLLPATEEDAS